MTPDFLTLPDRRLAYQLKQGARHGRDNAPGVVFLAGFASDMTGTKAGFLAEKCAALGVSFLRFDYRGHGQSSGDFREGTIGSWFDDCRVALDRLTQGPQIVIGSSMGGWLGLMLAAQKPERVKSFIGIAAAPDFTEDMMWTRLSPGQRQRLETDGFILDETAPPGEQAPITLRLIEEARGHLMLRKTIPLQCPVRLLQGMNDAEVPWQHAIRIIENVATDDARIIYVKDGDHRLSRAQDLDLLWRVVGEFV